ncbi:uncharacterized protein LOC123261070 [Cotesia glomerata]|uniref:uncharacterized protein LOC123261070 n=1 Tax=Cotesia glomerata TaxID=32391 RepID=UPI001D02C851|nr:uncharacterized protein LOC123261070 [Cotesia glomerata]
MKNGVTKNPKIYNERFSILYKFYKEIEPRQKMQWTSTSDKKKSKALVISRVIDCNDNVTRLWNNLFQDEPSLFENFLCESQQCNFQLSKPAIGVDYHVLLKNGIQDLQSALIFRGSFKKLCPVCKSIQTCEQKLNMYIYIELDIRLRNDIKGLSCKLRNFPIILNIKESQTKVLRYRLCGVIGHNVNHYIAYCRRLSGIWRFYNDMLPASQIIGDHTEIVPHGVLYLRENSVDE